MPILVIALLAIAVFGAIGGLLTAAVIVETRKNNAAHPVGTPKSRPAA